MGGHSDAQLLLDSSIRDWVVLPMFIMLILVGMGRHYVQSLIKTEPSVTEKELKDIRYKQTMMAATRLRMNGRFINEQAFNMRKAFLIRKKTGLLREKVPGAANPMANPMAMMDMMKGNISYMLPNIAMMSFVGYFFSGFVCLKVPFSLPSIEFKLMTQRGVDLSTLDVSYVSSLSWYFLVMFGMNDVYMLLLGEGSEMDDQRMLQMQMGMGFMGGGNQMGFDASAAYRQERDMLSIVKHEWVAEEQERRLLGDRYPETSAADIDLSKFSAAALKK